MGVRSCRVVFHNKIRYILDAEEMSFITHLIYLSDLRDCGCRTAYSKDFNFKSFQLKRDTFYRCAKRLIKLGLVDSEMKGRFNDYILIERNYNRLLEIINSTDDVDILLKFSQREFIVNNKSIDMITDSDIHKLKIRGDPLYLRE